jgi:hypothetical protein
MSSCLEVIWRTPASSNAIAYSGQNSTHQEGYDASLGLFIDCKRLHIQYYHKQCHFTRIRRIDPIPEIRGG